MQKKRSSQAEEGDLLTFLHRTVWRLILPCLTIFSLRTSGKTVAGSVAQSHAQVGYSASQNFAVDLPRHPSYSGLSKGRKRKASSLKRPGLSCIYTKTDSVLSYGSSVAK